MSSTASRYIRSESVQVPNVLVVISAEVATYPSEICRNEFNHVLLAYQYCMLLRSYGRVCTERSTKLR